MKSARTHKMALLAFGFFLTVCAVGRSAAERVFPDFNIAVIPPDSWRDVTALEPEPGLVVAFADPENVRFVSISRIDVKGLVPDVDDKFFIAGLEVGAEKSGAGRRLSSRILAVQGIKLYERTSSVVRQGRTVSTIERIIPIEGHSVNLVGLQFSGGTAAEDPAIQQVLDSFRFLKPPPRTNSAIYLADYRLGNFDQYIAILSVVVFGAIVLIIVLRLWTKARSSPPPLPPPTNLPPAT